MHAVLEEWYIDDVVRKQARLSAFREGANSIYFEFDLIILELQSSSTPVQRCVKRHELNHDLNGAANLASTVPLLVFSSRRWSSPHSLLARSLAPQSLVGGRAAM